MILEKPNYKLRLIDFIPVGGIINYRNRNEYRNFGEGNTDMCFIGRDLILLGYNANLFLGTFALVAFGAFKGLESIL